MKQSTQQPVDEPYALTNPPPRPPTWRGREPGDTRQRMLFCGLDCLPGQRNLFETDGQSEPEAG
jgi:hypothetical protein